MSESGPSDVAPAFARLAADRFGGTVELVGTPDANMSGFESAIFFMQIRGDRLPADWSAPLVLRVKPSVDDLGRAQREAAVQNWLAERGYPVPRVLAVLDPGALRPTPVQVMQRVPGEDLLARVARAPWTVRRRLRQFTELQVQLHGIDPTGFPVGDDLLDRRLGLVRRSATQLGDEVRAGLAWVDARAEHLRDAPTFVCHGDFHPLNAVTDGERMAIIDWSDAGCGDRHGDVARTALLFDMAWVASSSRAERAALRVIGPLLRRAYLRNYRRYAPLDEARLALWTPVHLLHGWAQGLVAGGDPALAVEFHRRFDAACRMAEHT